MSLEGDNRVGLRSDSIILSMWDNMSQKEKDEYIRAETEDKKTRRSRGKKK